MQRLRHIDCDDPAAGTGCPDRSVVHNLTVFEGLEDIVGVTLPETENHVLAINAWNYLMGQWDENPDRSEEVMNPRAPSVLEDELLTILGRVMTNGLWETNSRAYQAYR